MVFEKRTYAKLLLSIVACALSQPATAMSAATSHGPQYLKELDNVVSSKCSIQINGQTVEKAVGEVWSSAQDVCMKHACELAENGTAREISFQEYCFQTCYNDFELVTREGQCCGECVRKRCTHQNKTHEMGEMWRSDDQCTFYECSSTKGKDDVESASLVSYKKSCSPLSDDCPAERIQTHECCPICAPENKAKAENEDNFIFPNEKYLSVMSKETYLKHPCRRECVSGSAPMACHYTFIVEWYETLSKACYDCPSNVTDCFRPHCIYGDGFRRSLLIVNRMMPGPAIEVCRGDTLVVDVENHLMGEGTSIHWHGLHQRGTPHFDGVTQISQCPIPSHTSFRYVVKADNSGTHWWHSHVGMQRADGAFGALIIREPKSELPQSIRDTYDVDSINHVMIMQDWDHKTGVSGFNSFHHSIGDNKPPNILINSRGKYFEPMFERDIEVSSTSTTKATTLDEKERTLSKPAKKTYSVVGTRQKRELTYRDAIHASHMTPFEVFKVQKGIRYRFRSINSGFLNCPLEISVDNHTLNVLASDGRYFEPVEVDSLVSYAGERFDFVINANQPIGNYWMRIRGLMDCDERFTKAHQGAIIRYNGAEEEEPTAPLTYDFHRGGFQMNSLNRGPGHVDSVSVVELTSLDPDTPELLRENADYKFFVYYDFYDKDFPQFNNPALYSIQSMSKHSNKFFGPQLNHISMRMPSTPLQIARERNDETKFCNSSSLAARNINCRHDFCECSHVIQVPLNATVEIILIDEGQKYDANHPFHLHGHDFRVVAMERVQATGVTVEQIQKLDEMGMIKRRLAGAPIKDTVTVPDGGYTVIRFLANNPGFWLMHCHIEFHVEVGMGLVFKVGDYHQMPPLPRNFPTCSSYKPMSHEHVAEEKPSTPQPEFHSSANRMLVESFLLISICSTFIYSFVF